MLMNFSVGNAKFVGRNRMGKGKNVCNHGKHELNLKLEDVDGR
jgi:hypothetical protein